MEYREMKNGYKPSLLGFGCMRFPLNEDGTIDEVKAEKMLDTAIAQGVNYIDTAFPYHNGDSEPFVGRVLKTHRREDYFLTTKLPIWNLNTLEDAKVMFEQQRERLQAEYFDFYLLHALDKEKWDKAIRLGIVAYCEQLKAEGKIRNFGFSFHDEYAVFEEIIQYRDWDFVQLQYNYLDTDEQAGDRGYALAEQRNIPLVVMEPVKGGSLAQLPEDIAAPMTSFAPTRTLSSWALRWCADKPNVKVILSGMSTLQQVEDNLSTFDTLTPLSDNEKAIIRMVADEIKARTMNGCTACAYCMPCPYQVNIPVNFKIWNDHAKYGNDALYKKKYEDMKPEERASNCKKCGKCELVCPQAISIRANLAAVQQDMNQL